MSKLKSKRNKKIPLLKELTNYYQMIAHDILLYYPVDYDPELIFKMGCHHAYCWMLREIVETDDEVVKTMYGEASNDYVAFKNKKATKR